MDEEVLKIANSAREHAMEAKEIASQVRAEQIHYEALQAERYKNIMDKMSVNSSKIDGIQSKAWWVAGTIITILLSAFGGAVILILKQVQ